MPLKERALGWYLASVGGIMLGASVVEASVPGTVAAAVGIAVSFVVLELYKK